MSYTYDQLKGMSVSELREIAKTIEHEAVQGYSQLNKEHLLVAMCKALSIDPNARKIKEGFDKARNKTQIKEWKKKRDEAIAKKDKAALRKARAAIHNLKGEIRRATIKA